jgi:glycosyltransferase involved in cell wall biosynthesis
VAAVRPDLVHLHSAKAGLAGRLVLRGRLPTVYSPHGWSFHAAGGPLRAAAVTWERAAARWCDRVLCVSEDERRTGSAAGIHATWDVVENGVDPDLFPTGPGARESARAELGVPVGVPLVVCVGRLSEAKGQDLLLAAWPTVRRATPEARLVLVGDGPMWDRLRAEAQPGVELVGSGPPQSWYAAADVVAVPSRWEGMALAPLEAMATARSVVAFDVDGLPGVLRENGAVVGRGQVEALGAAIGLRLTSEDMRRAEELANLETVRSRYDVSRSTAGTLEVYRHVLAARGGADG